MMKTFLQSLFPPKSPPRIWDKILDQLPYYKRAGPVCSIRHLARCHWVHNLIGILLAASLFVAMGYIFMAHADRISSMLQSLTGKIVQEEEPYMELLAEEATASPQVAPKRRKKL